MSSTVQGVRFAPGNFKYNGRAALALVPSLIVAASMGGRPVMDILTIGAMIWYIMDALQYREGAFTVVSSSWSTVRHPAACMSQKYQVYTKV